MDNVTSMKKEKPKFWCVVTDTSNYPTVYEIGDYIIGLDPFVYLFKDTQEDERPVAIFNMSYIASVEFFDEKPKILQLDEAQIEELLNEEGEMAEPEISSDQSMDVSEE